MKFTIYISLNHLKIKWLYFFAGKREQTMTVTSVEVPNSESHSGAEKKRNSSEGSIEAYPYANEDTNETIEGKILFLHFN